MKCYLVGAGDFAGSDFILSRYRKGEDLLIAVDGGLDNLKKAGISPDLFVGDKDSVSNGDGGNFTRIVLPEAKDYTDMFFAAEEGIKRGCDTFFILAGTGGRFDHTLGNIQLVANIASRGCKAFLIGDDFYITAIKDGSIRLSHPKGTYFSVVSFTDECVGVSEKNVKYEIDGFTMKNTDPRGISNEFIGGEAEISVKSGILIICAECGYGE